MNVNLCAHVRSLPAAPPASTKEARKGIGGHGRQGSEPKPLLNVPGWHRRHMRPVRPGGHGMVVTLPSSPAPAILAAPQGLDPEAAFEPEVADDPDPEPEPEPDRDSELAADPSSIKGVVEREELSLPPSSPPDPPPEAVTASAGAERLCPPPPVPGSGRGMGQ